MSERALNVFEDRLVRLMKAMSPVVSRAMLEHFSPDCCIATCKIMTEVFAFHGFKAQPIATTMTVLNGPMQELLRNGPLPADLEERRALLDESGAWSVGIGPFDPAEALANGQKEDGFKGHLVLRVGPFVVDGALKQAARPEKGIDLPEMLWFKPPTGFFAARSKGQRAPGVLNGCVVTYRRLDDENWRQSRNWRDQHAGSLHAYFKILTGVLREMENRIDRIRKM